MMIPYTWILQDKLWSNVSPRSLTLLLFILIPPTDKEESVERFRWNEHPM